MPETLELAAGNSRICLFARGDRICQSVLGGKPFEPQSLAAWSGLCAGGGLVLDVGAYTGLYAIAAALNGCKVIAFEPLPKNAAQCRANFEENGVEVDLRRAAVSDKVGKVKIHYNEAVRGFTSGGSMLVPSGKGPGANIGTLSVPCLTLDSLRLKGCAAVKIDVERAEPQVLAGARKTLERFKPALLIEVLDEERERGVRWALRGLCYKRERVLDERNWLMVAT